MDLDNYPVLKYRRRYGTTVDSGILDAFLKYSKDTDIPQSRLADMAFEQFLESKGIEVQRAKPKK